MTDEPIDRDPADDEPRDDRPGDGGGWMSTLLTALERLDELSASGGRSRLDYDVSIGTLDDELDRRRERSDRTDRPGGGLGAGREDRRSASRHPRRTRQWPSNRYHVDTRTAEDELQITADLAGVDREDVTVGFDDGALVVAVEGREIERVRPQWADPTANATVRNGVLTVRVEPAGDDS